jgi:DNA-binding GntR family transcriptional regulator
MRKLESERLIVYARNRGARVAPVIEDEVRDLYDTRIALETEALRRSWSVFRPADVDAMWAVRKDMLDSVARGDSRSHELHRKLHMSLYEAVKSPWLDGLIELLWDHSERYRRLLSQKGLFYDQGDVRHKDLIEAVSVADFDAAAAALRRDLERGRDDMISMLRQDGLGVVTDTSKDGLADVVSDGIPGADAAETVAALPDRR